MSSLKVEDVKLNEVEQLMYNGLSELSELQGKEKLLRKVAITSAKIADDAPFYEGSRLILVRIVGLFALIAAGFSAFFIFQLTPKGQHFLNLPDLTTALIVYAICALLPPAWFFFEYQLIFPYKNITSKMADLKYTQELAQKFWAGVLIVLGVAILAIFNIKP